MGLSYSPPIDHGRISSLLAITIRFLRRRGQYKTRELAHTPCSGEAALDAFFGDKKLELSEKTLVDGVYWRRDPEFIPGPLWSGGRLRRCPLRVRLTPKSSTM